MGGGLAALVELDLTAELGDRSAPSAIVSVIPRVGIWLRLIERAPSAHLRHRPAEANSPGYGVSLAERLMPGTRTTVPQSKVGLPRRKLARGPRPWAPARCLPSRTTAYSAAMHAMRP